MTTNPIPVCYSLSDSLFYEKCEYRKPQNPITVNDAKYHRHSVLVDPELLYDNLSKLSNGRRVFYEYALEGYILKPYIDIDKIYKDNVKIEDPAECYRYVQDMITHVSDKFYEKYDFDLKINFYGYTDVEGFKNVNTEDDYGRIIFEYKKYGGKHFSSHIVFANVKHTFTVDGSGLLNKLIKEQPLYQKFSECVFDKSVYNKNRKFRHPASNKDVQTEWLRDEYWTPRYVKYLEFETKSHYYNTKGKLIEITLKPFPEDIEWKEEKNKIEGRPPYTYCIINDKKYYLVKGCVPVIKYSFIKRTGLTMSKDDFLECCVANTNNVKKHLTYDELKFIIDSCYEYIAKNNLCGEPIEMKAPVQIKVKQNKNNTIEESFQTEESFRTEETVLNDITGKYINVYKIQEFENKYTHLFYHIYFDWDFNTVINEWSLLLKGTPIKIDEIRKAFIEAYMTHEHSNPIPQNILTSKEYTWSDRFGLKSLFQYQKHINNDEQHFSLIEKYYSDKKYYETFINSPKKSIEIQEKLDQIIKMWSDEETFKQFNRQKQVKDKISNTLYILIQRTKRYCFIAQNYTYEKMFDEYQYSKPGSINRGMMMLDFCRCIAIVNSNYVMRKEYDLQIIPKNKLLDEIAFLNAKNKRGKKFILDDLNENIVAFKSELDMNCRLMNITNTNSEEDNRLVREFIDLMSLSFVCKNDFYVYLGREAYRMANGLKRCSLSILNIGPGGDYKSKLQQFTGSLYPQSMCAIKISAFTAQQLGTYLTKNYLGIEELPKTIKDSEELWNQIKSFDAEKITSRYMCENARTFVNKFCLDMNSNNENVLLFSSDLDTKAAYRRVLVTKRQPIGEENYKKLNELLDNRDLPKIFRNYLVYTLPADNQYHIKFNDEYMTFDYYLNEIRNGGKRDMQFMSEFEYNFWENSKPMCDIKFNIDCCIDKKYVSKGIYAFDFDSAMQMMLHQANELDKRYVSRSTCETMIRTVLGQSLTKSKQVWFDSKNNRVKNAIDEIGYKKLIEHFQVETKNCDDEILLS